MKGFSPVAGGLKHPNSALRKRFIGMLAAINSGSNVLLGSLNFGPPGPKIIVVGYGLNRGAGVSVGPTSILLGSGESINTKLIQTTGSPNTIMSGIFAKAANVSGIQTVTMIHGDGGLHTGNCVGIWVIDKYKQAGITFNQTYQEKANGIKYPPTSIVTADSDSMLFSVFNGTVDTSTLISSKHTIDGFLNYNGGRMSCSSGGLDKNIALNDGWSYSAVYALAQAKAF